MNPSRIVDCSSCAAIATPVIPAIAPKTECSTRISCKTDLIVEIVFFTAPLILFGKLYTKSSLHQEVE
jgi:hypothetical protein